MDDVRLLLFSHDGSPLGELSRKAGTLLSCEMSLEINGEHSISITTGRHLEVGTRALMQDPNGRWREWVVDEVDESHADTRWGSGDYHLIWSLQYDLQTVFPGDVHQPGMGEVEGCGALTALECALSGTKRWTVGTVDVDMKSCAIMCYNSAWDRLNIIVKYWGGEIDDTIEVNDFGVVARRVNLFKHQGTTNAFRRLEWHHDMTSIDRNPDPGPYYCRVMPLGNGETEISDDGETTFSWPIDLSEIDLDKCLRDEEAELLFRVPDGAGGWEYPTLPVTYSTDDPEILYLFAVDDLHAHTRPKVSYSATISQFAEAGMNIEGLGIGDEIQVLDYGFNEEFPLRIQERVLRLEWDLFGIDDKKITIGRKTPSLERMMSNIVETIPYEYTPPVIDFTIPTVPSHEVITVETPEGDIPVSIGSYEPIEVDAGTEQEQRISDLEKALADLLSYDQPGYEYGYDPETGSYGYGELPCVETAEFGYGEEYPFGTSIVPTNNTIDPNTGEQVSVPVGWSYEPSDDGLGTFTFSNGGDGWIHQINGVTCQTGTVNFVTTKPAASSDSSESSTTPSGSSTTPSGSSSSSTPSTNPNSDTSDNTPILPPKRGKTIRESSKAADNVKKRANSEPTNEETVADKRNVAIQTAALGNKTIDLNDPWTSSGGTGEIVDPFEWIKKSVSDLFTGNKD